MSTTPVENHNWWQQISFARKVPSRHNETKRNSHSHGVKRRVLDKSYIFPKSSSAMMS